MNNEIVLDPLGNQVLLLDSCKIEYGIVKEEKIIDTLFTVIEKPALLYEFSSQPYTLCYYSAFGWGRTIFVFVEKTTLVLQVQKCLVDAPANELLKLFKKGKLLYTDSRLG